MARDRGKKKGENRGIEVIMQLDSERWQLLHNHADRVRKIKADYELSHALCESMRLVIPLLEGVEKGYVPAAPSGAGSRYPYLDRTTYDMVDAYVTRRNAELTEAGTADLISRVWVARAAIDLALPEVERRFTWLYAPRTKPKS